MSQWLSRNRMIVAALAFAILLPLLAFVGDLSFVIALGLSSLCALGLYFAIAGNTPVVEIDSNLLDAGQRETARQILSEALADVERLAGAAKRIKNVKVRDQVKHLIDLFNKTISEVTREPERLSSVRRLLTFYAPKAADIADAYVSIEQSPRPDTIRLNRAEESLRKLDEAWAHFTDKLTEPDRTNLDIELDLLDQSLKSDMEKLPWR